LLFELFLTLGLLSAGIFLLCLPDSLAHPTDKAQEGLIGVGVVALVCFLLAVFVPKPHALPPPWRPQDPFGQSAGLELGLQTKAVLPLVYQPKLAWLGKTLQGRRLTHKPIGLFQNPQFAFRRAGAEVYFDWRYGLKQASKAPFSPRLIVLHSTEGEDEAHAFAIFNRNTSQQYLGGAWTHFSIDPQGQIYQYSPLNRISKGQAGIDDQAVGIELVGTASLWSEQGLQTRKGSIIQRWQAGEKAQLESAVDLVQTLQDLFEIPNTRIYSHEDIGKLALRIGFGPSQPDYFGLRESIRDTVYLALKPDLGQGRKPDQFYGFLEPYDRQDPGKDVMRVIYASSRAKSWREGKGPKN